MLKCILLPVGLLLSAAAMAQQNTDTTQPKKIIICGPSRSSLLTKKPDSLSLNKEQVYGGIHDAGRSHTSDQPLYIINGTPQEDGYLLQDLDPNDILSINVLKYAAATALYGTRGYNGVILISTKSFVENGLYALLSKYSIQYRKLGACTNCLVYIRGGKIIRNEEKEAFLDQLRQAKIEKVEVVEQPVLQQQYNITDKQYGIITTYKIISD